MNEWVVKCPSCWHYEARLTMEMVGKRFECSCGAILTAECGTGAGETPRFRLDKEGRFPVIDCRWIAEANPTRSHNEPQPGLFD